MFHKKPVFGELQLCFKAADEVLPAMDDLESRASEQQIEQLQQSNQAMNSFVSEANEIPSQLNQIIATLDDEQVTFTSLNEGFLNQTDNHDSVLNILLGEIFNENEQYYNRVIFNKGNSQDTCCICINDFQEDEGIVKLHCEHVYHGNCIDKWIQTQKKCPLCNVNLPSRFDRMLDFLNININHQFH